MYLPVQYIRVVIETGLETLAPIPHRQYQTQRHAKVSHQPLFQRVCYIVGAMDTRMRVFLERYFTHHGGLYIGFSYIIMLLRVFLRFGLFRVSLVSATLRKVTLEKCSHASTQSRAHVFGTIFLGHIKLGFSTKCTLLSYCICDTSETPLETPQGQLAHSSTQSTDFKLHATTQLSRGIW